MRKILLIEDDPTITKIVELSLKNDFHVVSQINLKAAQELLETDLSFDLIIIDRHLPDGDGISICYQLRQSDAMSHVPILFLSAADKESDKISGLYAGADDYITKPFSPLEFKARVLARLRHLKSKTQHGPLKFDHEAGKVFHFNAQNEIPLELTRNEFKILYLLAQSPERIFSRELILDRVWGQQTHVNDRVVDAHMSHLRKKLSGGDVKIECLRNEGYRLIFPSPKKSAS